MSDEPTEVRVTTTIVKEQVLKSAIRFMTRAGLQVQENRHDNIMNLTITVPPESKDMHGDRFKKMRDAKPA